MAATTLPRPSAETPGFDSARRYYQILRERMNQTAAVAAALGMYQEPDTHAYHLAELLDSRMGDATVWLKLDAFFSVDHNGNDAEVNHG